MHIVWFPFVNENRPKNDDTIIINDSMGSLELIESLDNISSVNYIHSNSISFINFRLNHKWPQNLFNHFLY